MLDGGRRRRRRRHGGGGRRLPAGRGRARRKIKKTDADPEPLALVRNPDVLAELVAAPPVPATRPVLVGFAAETDDVLGPTAGPSSPPRAATCSSSTRSATDMAFDQPDNAAVILAADGSETEVPHGPKDALADAIWDLVAACVAASKPDRLVGYWPAC